MTATMDQQLEETLAALGEEQRREVLDFARSLRRDEEEDEEAKALLQMLECIHAMMHRLRLLFEGDAPTEVVVIHGRRPYPDPGYRRPRHHAERRPD